MSSSRRYRNSLILCRCLLKQPPPILRSFSIFSKIRRQPIMLEKSEYKVIYKFSFIPIHVAIIKSGQTNIILSVLSYPFVYYFVDSLKFYIILLISGCLHYTLALGFSKVLGNVVGKIYVNKEGEVKSVMFSSVDKYGRRIDRIHKVEELINCEYPTKLLGQLGFIQISVENNDYHYKVNVRNCKIFDMFIWENLFGKIPFSVYGRKQQRKLIEIKEDK